MDGSVKLAYCGMGADAPNEGRHRMLKSELKNGDGIKHGKFVKTICWSPLEPIVASA